MIKKWCLVVHNPWAPRRHEGRNPECHTNVSWIQAIATKGPNGQKQKHEWARSLNAVKKGRPPESKLGKKN